MFALQCLYAILLSTVTKAQPIRLVINGMTGTNHGRLEVLHNSMWGTVCDDDFDNTSATVVCKILGFSGSGVARESAAYGQGTDPIWLDDVRCRGYETSIDSCPHSAWSVHNCNHGEDVGVDCIGNAGCNAPPYIANGRFSASSMSVNSFAYLRCDSGYVVAGVDHIQCQAGGSWTLPSGNCTPKDCGRWEYLDDVFANFSDITYTQNTTYGSSAVLRCKHGYQLRNSTENSLTSVCQANATWSVQTPPLCVEVDCGNWEYSNSSRETFSEIEFSKNTTYGSVATSRCVEGYQVINSSQKTATSLCQANGTWSVKYPPLCTEVDCGMWVFHDSTWDKYSSIQYFENTRFRSTALATCIDGYHLINSTKNSLTSKCQANGTWSIASPPLCVEVDCGRWEYLDDLFANFSNITYTPNTTYGSSAVLKCKHGYQLRNSKEKSLTTVCQANATWSVKSPPLCVEVDCGNWEYSNSSRESFSKIEFSKNTTYGSVAISRCVEGYQVINSSQKTVTSLCQANGTWSVKSPPLCTEVDCGKWVFHDSSWAKYSTIQYFDNTRFRSTALATCIDGFHLINSTKNSLTSKCQANGTWSIASPPLCVEVECPSLKISNDVFVAFNPPNSSYFVNITAVFTCPTGYNILGASKIACQPNGAWTAIAPTCFQVPGRDKACPFDIDSRGTHWNKSDAGLITFIECPENYSGQVSRQCSTTGEWLLPLYNCITAEVANVEKSLESILEHPEKAAMVVDEALEKLKDITKPVDDAGLYDGEVEKVASILDHIASISENMVVSDNQSQNFLDTASNLLDPSTSNTWKSIGQSGGQITENQDKTGAERVLNVVSKFTDAITKTLNASDVDNKTVLTSNLVVHASKIQNDTDMTMFSESQDKYNISSNLILYKESLKGMSHYTSVVYKNLSGILSARSVVNGQNNTRAAITSSVISVTVDNWERNKDDFKIDLYLGLFEGANGKPQCSFWNDSKSGWDNDGCVLLTTNVSVTVCRCYHLTNFAILMSPWTEVSEDSKAIDIISIAGCSISLFALVLTVISHAALWRYLRSDRVVILMHLSVSLVLSYAVFLGGVDRTENKDACTAIAALLHYIYLVVFFLMLAEGIEIAVTVLYVFNTKSRLKWLLPAAWLIPAVVVGISLGARQLKGYGNEKFCWLTIDRGLIWAFVVPALTIIIVNVVLLVLVIKTAFTTTLSSQKTNAEKVKTGIRCLCVLMPIMGCTWVIGVFYVNSSSAWIQYVFAICNGLQGLVIFICHCVLNKQVQTAISKRRKKYRDSQMSSNSTSLSFRKLSRMSITSELDVEIPGKFGIVEDRDKTSLQSSGGNFETTKS